MPTRPSRASNDLASQPPLIVTALLGAESFEKLDALRRRHFPAALNRVPAHISFFHHLPGDETRSVIDAVREVCASAAPVELAAEGVHFLGKGVAIAYPAAPLLPMHGALAQTFAPWLMPQDRQPFRPHVTIQNKVAPEVARALQAELQGLPLPVCRVEGLRVWRYLGGPWEPVTVCRFEAQ